MSLNLMHEVYSLWDQFSSAADYVHTFSASLKHGCRLVVMWTILTQMPKQRG